MTLKKVLLGTTALLGAGAVASTQAQAQDLEVGLSGFARSLAAFGDLDEESGVDDSRSFYFRNDTEVHVNVRGTDDETGLSYGATVEFEADTSSTANTDETWLFISGGFGEIRMGDEDGAVDNSKLGAQSVAAGTGGIDGAGEVASVPFTIQNSSDATKVRYYSPSIGGFQIGVSYTPDSGHGGSTENPTDNDVGQLEDWIEAAAAYKGSFSGLDIAASIVGGFADGENEGDFSGFQVGGVVGFSGFNVGGAFFTQENDVDGNNGDRDGFNIGIGATLGPAAVSVNYGYADNDADDSEPEAIVVSATVGLLPGVSLQGDVNFFNRDVAGDDDDDGITGVARLHVAF
ncbi:MAG: porin [Geminicoccaceae bacterium]|nr:porin [Geminicoccaceae bacterium]